MIQQTNSKEKMSSSARIGIDGGGTHTRAVVVDEALRVLGSGTAASSNHYAVGMEAAASNVRRAARQALEAACVPLSRVGSWGLGLAGACTREEQNLWRAQIEPLAKRAPFVVDEDAVAAWAGAFAGEPGAVCIAGTGANCFGVAPDGKRARADGLGPLLGDRGSGYRIGEAALRAACLSHDGGRKTALLPALLASLGAANVDELVVLVYAPNFGKDRIAALVPVVADCASVGDQVARDLLNDAGHQLAETAAGVMRRLDVRQVAACGGALSASSSLRPLFEKHLKKLRPGALVVEPRHDAAIGAALLPQLKQ